MGGGGEGHFEFYWGKKNVAKEWRNQVKQHKWPQWRDFTQSIISLSCISVEQIHSGPCNWGEWHSPVYPGLLRLLLLCLQFVNRATFILSIPVWIRCSISLNVILQNDTILFFFFVSLFYLFFLNFILFLYYCSGGISSWRTLHVFSSLTWAMSFPDWS